MVINPPIKSPIELPLRHLAQVLTNVGRAIVTGRLLPTLPTGSTPGNGSPQYVAWGTGTTTAAATQTSLVTEATEARTQGTVTQQQTSVSNDTLQVQGTILAVAGKTISEAGLFDTTKAEGGVAGGNMFARADFAGVGLSSGDSIAFTFRWQLQ